MRSDDICFVSDEDQFYVSLLADNDELSDEEWDQLFSYLDRLAANNGSPKAVLSAIRRDHVEGLFQAAPELFHALGNEYANFAENHGFNFDFCDVIASISQIFYDRGEIDLKANIALAMLELGTSHNRYFVERKFIRMVSPDISQELADRIAVEVDVRDIGFQHRLQQVKRAISVNDDAIHPTLAELQS